MSTFDSLRCAEHLKEYKYFCSKHLNVLCSLCTQKLHNRRCHLIPLNTTIENPYYTCLFDEVCAACEEALCRIQQNLEKIDKDDTEIDCTEHATEKKTETEEGEPADTAELLNAAVLNEMYHNFESAVKMRISDTKRLKIGKVRIVSAVTIHTLLATLERRFQKVHKTRKSKLDNTSLTYIEILKQCIALFQENELNSYGIEMLSGTGDAPEQVELILNKQINIPTGKTTLTISSCFFMPNNKIIFFDTGSKALIIYHCDSSCFCTIQLYGQPWDASPAGQNRVVVRYSNWNWFELLDIADSGNVESKKILRYVSFQKKLVFCSYDGSSIDVHRPSGALITSVPKDFETVFSHISADKNNVYFISTDQKTVCCKRKDEKITQTSKFGDDTKKYSIASADNGYIFITLSNGKIVVLNFDSGLKQIIKINDTNDPMSCSFDRQNNRLLVCNYFDGRAFLYDVKFPEF